MQWLINETIVRISQTSERSTNVRSIISLTLLYATGMMVSTAEAVGRVGLTVGVAAEAGTFDSGSPVVSPSVWLEVPAMPGFRNSFEFFIFSTEMASRTVKHNRTTLWIERIAEYTAFKQDFTLSSGLGWSYLSRSDGSRRGALGFRAALIYPFKFLGGRPFEAGFRYTGTPWAGTGAVEDRIELTFGAILFGKPPESNRLP